MTYAEAIDVLVLAAQREARSLDSTRYFGPDRVLRRARNDEQVAAIDEAVDVVRAAVTS